MKVAPSMLACDFARMGEEIKRVSEAGADYIHLDIMDGSYVPNISFGPAVVKSLRKHTELPFDVHLMIEKPSRYIGEFLRSGADIITFHEESEPDPAGTLRAIRAGGALPALAIKPDFPAETVYPYLEELSMILVMTVEPGFGGQAFRPEMTAKLRKLKAEIERRGLDILLEVDGGINPETAVLVAEAGADIAVAGTSVFGAKDAKAAISALRNAGKPKTGKKTDKK